MAPIQQKFTVIPEPPTSRSNGSDTPTGPPSKPPMTSKQAKKLYKAANKGPKLSKAEQRRQDLFEQDRIRKEFEKEKNQARAKASRDKRREKEEKEKAAKRKKGLPLVEVHPSQDTLARFIRPQPEAKPKEEPAPPVVACQDDDSDFTLPAESDAEPPSKRRKAASPSPKREARDARDPSFATSSRPAHGQAVSSLAPRLPSESKIERPSKRQKSSSPLRQQEAQWSQDRSLARCSSSARKRRSSSPAPQEQVPRGLEPTRTNSSPPKSPEQHIALPPQPAGLCLGQVDEPTDYDADAAEMLDLLAQQIANESFSAEDFLLTDDPVIQSKSKAPVSGPITPRLAESPRHGRIRSNSISERIGLDDPNANTWTRTTPGQSSGVVDILNQNQAPTKKPIGGEVLPRTGAETHPDTVSKACSRDHAVPKPLDTHPKPPRSAENLTHSAANPSNSTRLSPRASESPKPISRSPLRDVSLNQAPQLRTGNEKGFAIKEPLEHTKAVPKTVHSVFRKPDLPRPASKTSREPRTPSMGPPTGPPRFKTPAYQTSGLSGNRPRFLPKAPPSPETRPATANSPGINSHTVHTPAPSSTQLFLSGLEDFFPSPSQELKEIFDDSSCTHRGAPANKRTQPAPSRFMPPSKTNTTRTFPAIPNKPVMKPPQRNSLRIAQEPLIPAIPICAPATPNISAIHSNQDDWLPPFSTQDFLFSSQDLREVEDTSSGKSQLVHAETGVKPAMKASLSTGETTSEPPALPAGDKQVLARGSGTRRTFHKPEPMALVESDFNDSQDPWLNLSSQQSKSSLPDTPTAVYSGAKATSFNSALEPCTTQQVVHMAQGGDHSPSKRHVEGNASRAEGVGTDGSSAPKQPSLSSAQTASPQKSPEALRPSPKPFFTSSGTKELTLLAIEKSKRTAREDEFARQRQKAEEDARQRFAQRRREMEEAKIEETRLAKEEEEKEARLAREEAARLAKEKEARLAREEAARLVLLERQDQQEHVARPSPQGRPAEDDQQGSELEDDEMDQLLLESALDGGLGPGGPAQTKIPPPELEDDEMDRLLLESALDGGLGPGGPAQTKIPPPKLEDDEFGQQLLESALVGGLLPIGPAQKKTSAASIFSTRKPTGNAGGFRSRSEGSFEKMMALAHKTASRRGQDQGPRNAAPAESATKHQAPVTASQETDYGDAEWDECDLDGFL